MLFFLQNSQQIPSLEAFIIIYVCLFLEIFVDNMYSLGTKGQLKKWYECT